MTNIILKWQLIFLLLFIFAIFDIAADDIIENNKKNTTTEYGLSGLVLELSCFNYFNVGLGYNWGTYSVSYGHFIAYSYGFFIEYKTLNELHFRLYYDIYGGSAGMLLGASGIITTDFENITVGIAPHLGVGFGPMNIFYRYNFYINNKFNCHEFVLKIILSSFEERKK